MKVIYTATATATGGRSGHARTDDGALDVMLVRPKEMGGPGKGGTNPEQLFACGYGACFASTIDFLARQQKLALSRNEVTARIGLAQRPQGGFGLTAVLEIHLEGVDAETATRLVAEAHTICPYSNSIAGNVDVEFRLKT